MANTANTLVQRPGASIAWVLYIEGHDVAFTDSEDTAGISAAWSGSLGGRTVRTGLEVRGSTSRGLNLLLPSLEPVSLSVVLKDVASWSSTDSIAAMMADEDEAATTTWLTADLDRDDTTITVASTSGFAASGTIYIGLERITYTGKTATTFTGCTRGTMPAAPGKSTWSHTFKIGPDGIGPTVSTRKRAWKNRAVALYLLAKDPDTNTWTTEANSIVEFVGAIEDWSHSGRDGDWKFDCISVEERMAGQLLRGQYRGNYRGFRLTTTAWIVVYINDSSPLSEGKTVEIPPGAYTLTSLLVEINSQLAGAFTWDVGFAVTGLTGEWRTQLKLAFPAGGATVSGDLGLRFWGADGYRVRRILGYTGDASVSYNRAAAGTAVINGAEPPIVTAWFGGGDLDIYDQQGSWQNQSSDDLPPVNGAEGYVRVGDADYLMLTGYTAGASGSPDTLDWLGNVSFDGTLTPVVVTTSLLVARYYGEDENIPVRQVWMLNGPLNTIDRLLLRMLLSTGTTNYNDATYDKWPASMGLGIPSTLVDIASIESFSASIGAAGSLSQFIAEPESTTDEIQSMMRTFGFHLVWRNGKITLIVPTVISGQGASYDLTTGNTGDDRDGGGATDTTSGIKEVINRLGLKYNRNPVTGDYEGQITADNLVSQSDYDFGGGQEYEARGLHDKDGSRIQAWIDNIAAPALAYFGRPIRRYRRTCAPGLWPLSVGDIVTFTDPDVPAAKSTAWGLTSEKAWVLAVSKNYDDWQLEVELAVPAGRSYLLAPTAMLDYSRGDKGYDSANARLYVRDHEFTRSSDALDRTFFYQGDVIYIVEIDPASSAAPTAWVREISNDPATDGYITLASALAAPAFDSTKRYYVCLDLYASSGDANTNRELGLSILGDHPVAYLANDADGVIDGLTSPPVLWGTFTPATDAGATPSGDDWIRNPYDQIDDDGAPLSSHFLYDLARGINVCLRHVADPTPISEMGLSRSGSTSSTYKWVAGPLKVRCPPGCIELNLHIWAKLGAAGSGFVRASCSPTPPTGDTSTGGLVFPADVNQVEFAVGSTSITDVGGKIYARPDDNGFTYVTLEMKCTAGAAAGTLHGWNGFFEPVGLP